MDSSHNDQVRGMYSHRAAAYDDARGGWHVTLGQEFVSWLEPQPGETAIDLACGTGLVTLPLAKRLGPGGKVVAVDFTPEMIQVGREKLESARTSGTDQELAPVTWLTGDIASHDLLSEPAVQDVICSHGGFDIISVCSAFVLLPNQPEALRFWVEKLLKKDGRVIIDVPTEELTLQFLITYHLSTAIGLPNELSRGRLWIEDHESLAKAFAAVGLVVEKNITTKSYLATIWYESDPETGLRVLEEQAPNYSSIIQRGKMDEARKVWPELWQKAARSRDGDDEGIEDAHRLYVYVGRKP